MYFVYNNKIETAMADLSQSQGIPLSEESAPQEKITFSGEGVLPRLPLPELGDSLRRFEEWCTPLLTAEELTETQAAIKAFAEGAGDQLQAAIKEYNQQEGVHSWLDEFWSSRYLGRRVPVSINANFIFTFIDQPLTQVQRAAELVGVAVRYKQQLDDEVVPPASMKGTPLCMEQHKFLFSTTRIPGEERDTVRAPYSVATPGASSAKHILVICKHQLFSLNVVADNGKAHSLNELEAALEKVIEQAPATPLSKQNSVGYLTTLSRTEWAGVRTELLAVDPANAQVSDTIEQALFCLCLDDAEPQGLRESADQLLHGDGANRWFDKSISLIVFGNGVAGVNCEHCGVDGGALVEFVDYLHNESNRGIVGAGRNESVGMPEMSPLIFTLNSSLETNIESAVQAFDALAGNTATHYMSFDDFGAKKIKSLKVSPDAFAQIGFQLAHMRTKGLIGATYESIATRHYDRGRTEAMRVVTPEIVAFVDAMGNESASDEQKAELFRAAAAKHSRRLRECQSGEAPEQHLWQLQLLAQAQGLPVDTDEAFRLFTSPGWLKMRNDYLSTSSAPSENITVFGFGATSEQCIGVAYLVRNDSITAYLSTPSPVAAAMHDFSDNLQQAYRDLAALLQ